MLPKPKKSLGQNFLVDPRVRSRIIQSCSFDDSDVAVEIGPGRGALTAEIARRVKEVHAIELDRALSQRLAQELACERSARIIQGDILRFDLAALARKSGSTLKIVGNIPYNISTPIIERLIENREYISSAYLMVQKEFGMRVTAKEGSKIYGALSCFVQYYFAAQVLFRVSKNCFSPAPKVDSLFLRLEPRKEPAVKVNDAGWLFTLIRQSFCHRRKTLKNCLKNHVSAQELAGFFKRYRIREDARPEMLSLQDFANLANLKNN